MVGKVIERYKQSKSLIHYFALTYLDKIISFALPLAILLLLHEKELYTFVEVIYSYAAIAMIALELGFSNYLFFGYKNAGDKEKFVSSSSTNFKFLLLVYALLAIIIFPFIAKFRPALLPLYAFVGIRSLFMLYLNFNGNIFRLQDVPARIYLYSIGSNVLALVFLFIAHVIGVEQREWVFFSPFLLVVAISAIQFLIFERHYFSISEFIRFAGGALRFSWPIILNAIAMNFIGNYAKIYGYDHLSKNELLGISYVLRIGLIIQLTHSAFASYYSKSIFMDESQGINLRIFRNYNLVLLAAAALVFCAVLITNWLFSSTVYIAINGTTILFLVYIVIWCYIGYFEIYFGRRDANHRILIYSLISAVVYILSLRVVGTITPLALALSMVFSAILNLILELFGLYKLNVIKFAGTGK